MSSKIYKNGAYKILVAQKDAITKIMGIITPKSIDTLKNKLGGAFTIPEVYPILLRGNNTGTLHASYQRRSTAS
jgi:hypothetical protein